MLKQDIITKEQLASIIDHALLLPILTDDELIKGCNIALKYNVASVCVKPYHLKSCAELLRNSSVVPSTVIGFPLGHHTINVKKREALQAIKDGGEGVELDIVINIGKVLSGDWQYISREINDLREVCHDHGAIIKIIFENCYLQPDDIVHLCHICEGCDFIKTSTGFGPSGAEIEDVKLMLENAGKGTLVKAAGGIRELKQVIDFWNLGVSRVGCSKTAGILESFSNNQAN